MDNNITNINEMSQEQIMEAIGQDDGSSKGVNIPRLGINRSPEDDDGNHVPRDHSTHTGHAKEGHKNGLASNGRMTSYDDSMNPFADDD